MFCDRSLFTHVSDKFVRWVENAIDSFSKVEEIGNVRVCLLDTDGKGHFVTFSSCLLLPDHVQNLNSVTNLAKKKKLNLEKSQKW